MLASRLGCQLENRKHFYGWWIRYRLQWHRSLATTHQLACFLAFVLSQNMRFPACTAKLVRAMSSADPFSSDAASRTHSHTLISNIPHNLGDRIDILFLRCAGGCTASRTGCWTAPFNQLLWLLTAAGRISVRWKSLLLVSVGFLY